MSPHKLKVFCTPFCPKCNQLLAYLKERKADYVSYNVDKDENARKEVIKLIGNKDVELLDKLPIVIAGSKVLYGFDKMEIDKHLH
ncbi:MAG TPA: glutaredoxin family protein [Candidatus Brocadiaceae bacterium]|nr:glutaredoxin family protein [Candidatus Brocadiaceae bacterium]